MSRPSPALPACYAIVQPGLEEVAADEITRDLAGQVKRTARGLVVFRLDPLTPDILTLKTVEDVFLLAWGSDELTYRAEDLTKIERWTRKGPNWEHLFRLHQNIRPRPRSRPTYHLVAQMEGEHGYRRGDAGKALARGLEGKLPHGMTRADDNAFLEVWVSIDEATAVCGVRLSDRTMRHRTYKTEHRPASLRPSVAAAMVRLARISPGQVVIDPMCGAGTILAEVLGYAERFRGAPLTVRGGDIEQAAVQAAAANLRRIGAPEVACWDARRLPFSPGEVDRIISNPPFGKQLSRPEEIGPLYRDMVREYDRVLKPGGQAILLVSEARTLSEQAREVGWKRLKYVRLRVLGQRAEISVWRKPEQSDTIAE